MPSARWRLRDVREREEYGTGGDTEGPCRAARVYRLGGDGKLEIAEGDLGTWTGDRSPA